MKRVTIATGLMALALAACGGADGTTAAAPSATPSATPSVSPSPDPSPTESLTSCEDYGTCGDTTDEPAPDEPTPDAVVEPEPKTLTYSGRGSKLLRIKKPKTAMIAVISAKGDSNFIVDNLGADGTEYDGLVNEIGSYKGTHLIDAANDEHTAAIKLDATGFSWKITLKPLSAARKWDGTGTLTGKGADVVVTQPSPWGPLDSVRITHSGQGNVIIDALSDSEEGLVNEIGRYSGEVQVPQGSLAFTILADGKWTFRKV